MADAISAAGRLDASGRGLPYDAVMNLSLRMAWFVLAAVTVGCSIRPPRYHFVSTPRAEVTSLAVTSVSEQGARVEAVVALENPNDLPLPLRVSDYTLSIDGVGQTTMVDLPPVTLPARGRQTFKLPIAVATDGAALDGQAYRFQGTVTYEPPGEIRRVLTDSGLPLPRTGFSSEGVFE